MNIRTLTSPSLFFLILILASPIVGWFIPGFYEWTDSDQSRPSPLLWRLPLASSIACLAFCMLLPWLPIIRKEVEGELRPTLRFSLRTLLIFATAVAVAIPMLTKFPILISGTVCAGTYLNVIIFSVRHPQHRMASAALIACMILPYTWVLGYGELGRILPVIAMMIGGMPAFIPAAILSRFFGENFHESHWVALLMTSLELLLGLWLIRLGPKRSIAYMLLVLHISVIGSLAFYQLCIA